MFFREDYEAAQEQASAGQQHEREPDLSGDEQSPQT
jgi:hypothetical protein